MKKIIVTMVVIIGIAILTAESVINSTFAMYDIVGMLTTILIFKKNISSFINK